MVMDKLPEHQDEKPKKSLSRKHPSGISKTTAFHGAGEGTKA
jgi:hypothetical protein